MKAYRDSYHAKVVNEFLVEVQVGSQSPNYHILTLVQNSGS